MKEGRCSSALVVCKYINGGEHTMRILTVVREVIYAMPTGKAMFKVRIFLSIFDRVLKIGPCEVKLRYKIVNKRLDGVGRYLQSYKTLCVLRVSVS